MEKSQRWSYVKDKAIVSSLAEQEWENSMDGEEEDAGDEDKRKRVMERARGTNTDRVPPRLCQVHRCTANLTEAKQYYRRHKVCEVHAKASAATVSGAKQRFCQQCSRYHSSHQYYFLKFIKKFVFRFDTLGLGWVWPGFMSYQSLMKLKEAVGDA